MKIDIYQSTKNQHKFLSVPENANVAKIPLDPKEAQGYEEVSSFKKGMSIDASDKRVVLNAQDIIQQIKSKGYALHGVKIEFLEAI